MSTKSRFDPRSILADLDDASASAQPLQTQAGSSATSPPDEEDEDDDFMSDKYLVIPSTASTSSETYTERRRKQLARSADQSRARSSATSKKSLRQREEEARRAGLDRDLLAEAEIVAGAGEDALPPLDKDGRRMWETLNNDKNAPFQKRDGEGLPSAGKGRSAAMKMMLAMGFKRGLALGRQAEDDQAEEEEEEEEEEEDGDEGRESGEHADGDEMHARRDAASVSDYDEDADEEQRAMRKEQHDQLQDDDYLTGGVSTARYGNLVGNIEDSPSSVSAAAGDGATEGNKRVKLRGGESAALTAPLRIDDRWLSAGTRLGIGMVPSLAAKAPSSVSSAIAAATSASSSSAAGAFEEAPPSAEQQLQEFRSRVSTAQRQRHIEGLLSRSRKTLQELDRAQGVAYNPFWLDSNLWLVLTGRTEGGMSSGELTEKIERDPATREAVELLEFAFGGDVDVDEMEREGKSLPPKLKLQAIKRKEEAEALCVLDAKKRLELTLSRLRDEHLYCLFCGCRYNTSEDLAQLCPGTEEDDHD